ncbi:MAG: FG-GAP-like repeat-containing protein [Caldilineaceae bacterium]
MFYHLLRVRQTIPQVWRTLVAALILGALLPGALAKGAPEPADANWWRSVQEYVERDLLAIRPATSEPGIAYSAENGPSGLAAAFPIEGGFIVQPLTQNQILQPERERLAAGPAWRWGLRPVAVGTRTLMVPLGVRRESQAYLETLANGYDVAWVLPGSQGNGFVEWFVNGKGGLRQGFTLAQRPRGAVATSGAATGGPMVLRLAQTGDLRAEVAADGQGLRVLDQGGGAVLKYVGLHVFDAAGRSLEAHFAIVGDQVEIVVADADAAYPVTIDPVTGMAASPDWSAEGENTTDDLAWSVAAAGDVNGDGYGDIVVGAKGVNSEAGKVYVFHGGADGIHGTAVSPAWSAVGEGPANYFGMSVAGAGDVNGDGYSDIIVGAYRADNNKGKAYVFHGSASGVTGAAATPAWSTSGEQESDAFGGTVASAGDVNGDGYSDVVVGAPDYAINNTGKVYVFYGSTSGVSGTAPSPAWSVVGANANDTFGRSAAGAGDVNSDGYGDLIVGAPYYANNDTGKVYVFHGSAGGLTGTAGSPAWSAEGENASDLFGWSVAGTGDVNGDGYGDIIGGAQAANGSTGRVYVFHGSAIGVSGTAAHPAWNAGGEAAGSGFGVTVAGAGDMNGDGYGDIVVGSGALPWETNSAGKLYVFHGGANGITGTGAGPAWSAVGEGTSSRFGNSVASAGDVNGDGYGDIVVGAPTTNGGRGKVYVFHGGASGVRGTPSLPAWGTTGEIVVGQFGYTVASAGDVNGDGYGDIVVGAPYANGAKGKVYVFHGSASGVSGTAVSPAWSAEGEYAGDWFGVAAAAAGDVNGDSYGDIVVGAKFAKISTGKVYVFFGGASGITGTALSPAWSTEGAEPNNGFGSSASSAGDVNGDGYGDIVVAASLTHDSAGTVYVFYGSAGGTTGSAKFPTWSAVGEAAASGFGTALAGAGDVNGDGYGDIVVGAQFYTNNTGKAYLFYGGAGGLTGAPANPAWSTIGEGLGNLFGDAVAGAGDVNGDGCDDIVVGAQGAITETGKVYLFYGRAGGLTGTATSPAGKMQGEDQHDSFGSAVAGAGDVNGDGFGDIVVGAQWANNHTGKIYVFHGSASGLSGTAASPAWSMVGEEDGDVVGLAAGAAGDVNGDGYGDIVVGAQRTNGLAGKVYLFHGGASGRPVLAQQLPANGGAAIQPWGKAEGGTMQVQMHAWSPWGRQSAKLQVQACPTGKAFGSAGCIERTSAAWEDVMAARGGVTLRLAIDGLGTGVLYHWRARVLYAPLKVTAAGITAPPHPMRGPWRRLNAQVAAANVQSISAPRTLRVTKTGSGTVTSSPVGINCGTTCSASLAYGTQVTLTAVSAVGASFEGWGEACSGSSICQVTMDASRNVSAAFTTLTGPQAVDDFGAAAQGMPLLLDVLANDRPGDVGDLTVTAVSQPVCAGVDGGTNCGVTVVEQNQVSYTPPAGFAGLAQFNYTAQDAAGLESEAEVTVRVFGEANLVGLPQTAVLADPAGDTYIRVNTPSGVTDIRVPEGAISHPYPNVTYRIVYAEFSTPTAPVPYSLFSYAGRAFVLLLFGDSQELDGFIFGRPLEVTIEYDPLLVPDADDLRLYYYNPAFGFWTNAGLSIMGVDEVRHAFTVSVPHLTEFAAGLPARSDEVPVVTPHLFLPAVDKP